MTDPADRRERRRVGQFCVRLSEERGPLAGPGPMRELASRIAAEIRTGRSAELSDDLDALEELLLRAGYTAGLSGLRSDVPDLPGIRGHPQLEVFACPAQACLRVALPDNDSAPVCPVLDQPLRRMRLGS